MPASTASPPEQMLSDTLSARSYLQLSREARRDNEQASSQTPSSQNLEEETSPVIKRSARHLRPRKRPAPQSKTESTKHEVVESSDLPADYHPARKRGRPRLETEKDAAAVQERRMQIRRAQRTYRLKKETTIQSLRTRVTVLEQTLQNVADLVGTLTTDDSLNDIRWPDLAQTRELVLAEINRTRATAGPVPCLSESTQLHSEQTAGSSDDIFGYQVLRASNGAEDPESPRRPSYHPRGAQKKDRFYTRSSSPPPSRSTTPLLNRLLPTTTIYTYSYQESDLSRRLQRFCLEHSYRWLTDPRSDPLSMARVFGLMTCIHEMPGVKRGFRRVLNSEIGGTLELYKMPYYTLGGASTHFPRVDQDGRPVYPDNIRRPGRVLRRMMRVLRRGGVPIWKDDWTEDLGDYLEWDVEESVDGMDADTRLRALDLDGGWFDCHDVQGYLEHRGVKLNGSSLTLEVPTETVEALYMPSPYRAAWELYASPETGSPVQETGAGHSTSSSYVLDVECFFDLLLANFRILGRAPGFRVSDVEDALRSTIQRKAFD